jgi:hypothetical protein
MPQQALANADWTIETALDADGERGLPAVQARVVVVMRRQFDDALDTAQFGAVAMRDGISNSWGRAQQPMRT